MAHFYDSTNYYPVTPAAGGFNIDPSLYQTSAAEEVGAQPFDTSFAAILRMLAEPYPGPMVGLPTRKCIHNNNLYSYGEHHVTVSSRGL